MGLKGPAFSIYLKISEIKSDQNGIESFLKSIYVFASQPIKSDQNGIERGWKTSRTANLIKW